MIGTTLSHFKVTGKLGEGGMGAVYRATDTRLGREVAVKLLPDEVVLDRQRLARFEREAQVLAALNDPHIAAIYQVDYVDGKPFLVMELAEGETLQERIARGPMPVSEALGVACRIASALDAAHQRGIIHRDLKPGNVVLTRSGPKLLDFGLAKLCDPQQVSLGGSSEPTLTVHGQIVGTLHYMAPEQLEGRAVDARTDVFAFGATLFEMVTGTKAFSGSSAASVMGAILRETIPPLRHWVPDAPPALERLVAICLEKEPENRWSSIHDVLLQLRGISDAPPESTAAAEQLPRRARAVLGMMAAAGVAIGLLVAFGERSPTPRVDAALRVLSIVPPDDATLAHGEAPQVAPSGERVAFVAIDRAGRRSLYVRELDALAARSLDGTDDATLPFWAPDGRRLGFFANGQLKIVAVSGGAPQTIAPAPVPRGGSWNVHDVILFVGQPARPASRVPATGGELVPVPTRDGDEFRWFPHFLPDGRHYLYLGLDGSNRRGLSVHVGSLDSGDSKELVTSLASAAYAPPGYLLFRRESSLLAQRFDARTLTLEGAPSVVVDGLGFNAITYQALFSASANVIAYQDSTPGSELVWFDGSGARERSMLPPGHYNTFCLTFDGDHVVYETADPDTGNVDLWSLEIASGVSTRLTFDPTVEFYPVCSPLGPEIVFASLREGAPNLFRQSIDHPGSDAVLVRSPFAKIATDWSRDGELLVYSMLSPTTSWDVHIMPLSGGASIAFTDSEAEERNARLSPDGRFIAYVSNESGSFEVYVRRVPATAAKWQVSRGGGLQPQWRRDGRGLYYLSRDMKLVSVDVDTTGTEFALSNARQVLESKIVGWELTSQGSQYAVTPDGARILVNTATDALRVIHAALEWTASVPGTTLASRSRR